MSTKSKGTTDESIGRPGPWREGRYQQSGQSLDDSVAPDPPLDSKRPIDASSAAKVPPSPPSTPVHLDEYTAVRRHHQGGKLRRERS
jgi:hypothetical protein